MRSWLLAAALALAPLAGHAQEAPRPRSQVTPSGDIQVVMGDRVTVRLPASGRPEPVSVERAPPGSAAPPKPGAGKFEDAPPGTVVFILERDGSTVLLKVLSGIDKAFDYRAQLMAEVSPGRWAAEPTSVCTVLPLLAGYETWEGRARASGILLSEFKLKDTNGVVCPKPK